MPVKRHKQCHAVRSIQILFFENRLRYNTLETCKSDADTRIIYAAVRQWFPETCVLINLYKKHAGSNYTVLKRGRATMSSAVPYRANWFMSFNGLLSQIKNLMPPPLKQPTVSEIRIYEIAHKTGTPQRNTNDCEERTSNRHILNFVKDKQCSKIQCSTRKRSCTCWLFCDGCDLWFLNIYCVNVLMETQ